MGFCMHRLLCHNLWKTIKKLSSQSGGKWAAVSYVTSDRHVTFGKGDTVVVDASDAAIVQGHTDASVLVQAFERGAELHSYPGLHSKLMVLNGHAVVGSANISASSADGLVEAAVVTDHPSLVGQAIAIIAELSEQGDVIDAAFLERITTLEVTPRTGEDDVRERRRTSKPPRQARTWIVGLHELARDFADDQDDIVRGEKIAERAVTNRGSTVSWIRSTGTSGFRSEAKAGDSVIQIWRGAKRKTPSAVSKHCLILRRQDESKCTRCFIDEPSDHEDKALKWKTFQTLVQRVGVSGRIGPTSMRPLKASHSEAFFSLWDEHV
jgi:hypothetical protein